MDRLLNLTQSVAWQLGLAALLVIACLAMAVRAVVCVKAGQAVPRQRPRTKADRTYFCFTLILWLGLAEMAAVACAEIIATGEFHGAFYHLRNIGFAAVLIGAGLIMASRFEILAIYQVPFPGRFREFMGRMCGIAAMLIGLGLGLYCIAPEGLAGIHSEVAAVMRAGAAE